VWAIYYPALRFGFVYDDQVAIVQNPLVTSGAPLVDVIPDILGSPYRPGPLYRPVTVLSYYVNAVAGELSTFAFHLVNILLHCGAAFLVFVALRHVVGRDGPACIAALLFAVHPVHVETVANIVGRAEQLALIFSLSALICSLPPDRGGSRIIRTFAEVLLFALALLSKESALSLVLILPLFHLLIKRASWGAALAYAGLLGGVALVVIALRFYVLGSEALPRTEPGIFAAANPLLGLSFVDRVLPALQVMGKYVVLFLLPLRLSADYSLSERDFWSAVYSLEGALLLFIPIAFGVLLWLRRRERAVLFLGLWFFAAFAFTSNVLLPIGTIMGERLLYFPAVGLCALVVLFLERIASWLGVARGASALLALPLLGLLVVRSAERLPVWRDNRSLFAATVQDSPLSPKAHFHFALELLRDHDAEGAYRHARTAHELMPSNVESMKVLFEASVAQQNLPLAAFWGRRILERAPDDGEVQRALNEITRLREENAAALSPH
jgi:hypothetical protein